MNASLAAQLVNDLHCGTGADPVGSGDYHCGDVSSRADASGSLHARAQDFFGRETFGRGEGSTQWTSDRRANLYRAAVQNGCRQGSVDGVDEGAAESEADGLFTEMHDLVV